MNKHIFFSYARADVEEVKEIVATLDAAGFSCWIDTEDLRFGVWTRAIEEAVRGAGAIVLLLSPRSVVSKWVTSEVELAKQCNVPIVPLELHPVEISESFSALIWEYQRIPGHGKPSEEWLRTLQDALIACGLHPQPMDLTDKRFLAARAFAETGNFIEAITTVEQLLKKRPYHLAAVVDLVSNCYEAGRARILEEEQRGIRPPSQPEMVDEFRRAEEIASRYLQQDLGKVNGFFRSQIWITLAMISSFLGMYDDAFKRLETARICDPSNKRPEELLSKLRNAVRVPHMRDNRGRERPYYEVHPEHGPVLEIPFPEPRVHTTWHAIAFPFTAEFHGFTIKFPDGVSEDWRKLWMIDHNIGQLERLDSGENVEKILLQSISTVREISLLELARLAWKRIYGAFQRLPSNQAEKKCIIKAARVTLVSLQPDVPSRELKAIWDPGL